jgi:hypothetical protein
VAHINQCVANAKRGLSLLNAAIICSWWYKSGYSWTSTDFFTPPIFSLGLSPALDAKPACSNKLIEFTALDIRHPSLRDTQRLRGLSHPSPISK